jgi:hypothetical protein
MLTTIPQYVYPVASNLGLPAGSLDNLHMALQGQGSFDAVQGLTPDIQATVMEPYPSGFRCCWQDGIPSVTGILGISSHSVLLHY